MIHLIEVDSSSTPVGLKRAIRRAAMTGGVELALKEELSTDQLDHLIQRFITVLETDLSAGAFRRASGAYRVLSLVLNHLKVSERQRKRILQVL